MGKDINRLKVLLAEEKRTNKWLAEQLGKDPAIVSKWHTNSLQPNVETLVEITRILQVYIQDLFWPFESIGHTSKTLSKSSVSRLYMCIESNDVYISAH